MHNQIAVQDTYPEDFAHCYGCGARHATGHRIKTFSADGETVTEYAPGSIYTGAGEFAYGGIIASLIDCHSTGSAAIFWMREHDIEIGDEPAARFVTARLEVDFVAPTPLGMWRLVGRAEEIGDRKVIVKTDLQVNSVTTARGRAVLVKVSRHHEGA
ncbi:MAG: PaaI family thioesterase [Actinomycetota bacterium]|nr:PaaI family thioesterase [Actinomycetota bacterium]